MGWDPAVFVANVWNLDQLSIGCDLHSSIVSDIERLSTEPQLIVLWTTTAWLWQEFSTLRMRRVDLNSPSLGSVIQNCRELFVLGFVSMNSRFVVFTSDLWSNKYFNRYGNSHRSLSYGSTKTGQFFVLGSCAAQLGSSDHLARCCSFRLSNMRSHRAQRTYGYGTSNVHGYQDHWTLLPPNWNQYMSEVYAFSIFPIKQSWLEWSTT